MYELTTVNEEGKTFMETTIRQVGRSRRRPALSFPKGKSRRQFARIINDGTHREFIKACKCIETKLVNNACVLDNQGNLIAFTTCRDISLPQFI